MLRGSHREINTISVKLQNIMQNIFSRNIYRVFNVTVTAENRCAELEKFPIFDKSEHLLTVRIPNSKRCIIFFADFDEKPAILTVKLPIPYRNLFTIVACMSYLNGHAHFSSKLSRIDLFADRVFLLFYSLQKILLLPKKNEQPFAIF